MRSPRIRRTGLAAFAGFALAAGLPAIPATAETGARPAPPPAVVAAAAADRAAASGLDALSTGPAEEFHRISLTPGGAGLFYAEYERSYAGLRVVGGDAVVVADGTGDVRETIVAPTDPIKVGTRPEVTAERASAVARSQVSTVERSTRPELVVLAGDSPTLAYEVVVTGRNEGIPSKLHVLVDADTGAVAQRWDEVRGAAQPDDAEVLGTGSGYYNGSVTIDTSPGYSMRDPNRSGVSCGDNNTKRVFTGSDDSWGNGSGTNLETACVDALYATQHEWDMLRDWLDRDGINGRGGGYPAWVGLNQANAYWNGSAATFGRSSDGRRQATPMDVVAHEFGHAIFQTTPGGSGGGGNEKGGLNESTGDIFGALTEFYAANPNDPPDYLVGEEVDLVGNGPIRNMYNPAARNHPNCYSSAIPNTEVHAAAGPQNHWFYLLAEGSNANPPSPTCDGSTVTGIGIQKAGQVFYNGLLRKTSAWTHAAARQATLAAALELFPGRCTEFDAVEAAWNAVSVRARPGEPTCDAQPPAENDFSLSVNPTSASVEPGQSVTVAVDTRLTEGDAQTVRLSASGLPSGATATFTPASVQSGDSSTLTIATAASTPTGTVQVTITGDGTDADHTVQLRLTVGSGSPPACDAAPWTAQTPYVPGDRVSHAGHQWESTWYSTGAEPGGPDSWATWRDLGAC